MFRCPCCGQYSPLRSNQAIYEEYLRLSSYLADLSDPACTNTACANHGVLLSARPGSYVKYDKTVGGSLVEVQVLRQGLHPGCQAHQTPTDNPPEPPNLLAASQQDANAAYLRSDLATPEGGLRQVRVDTPAMPAFL